MMFGSTSNRINGRSVVVCTIMESREAVCVKCVSELSLVEPRSLLTSVSDDCGLPLLSSVCIQKES